MQIADELLSDKELTNFLRERVPMFFDFGNEAVAYSWNPAGLADELREWFRGKIRINGQQWPELKE